MLGVLRCSENARGRNGLASTEFKAETYGAARRPSGHELMERCLAWA